MNVETYLDYNELLKVAFDIGEEDISYGLSCETEDKRQNDRIVKNLSEITNLEPTENPDVYRLTINDSIYVNVSKSTGELEVLSKLTAFETRSLGQTKEMVGAFSRDKQTDFVPKTDLHTHFAGALSPDILVDVGIKHGVKYKKDVLEKIGIDMSRYEVDDKGMVELASINEKDIKVSITFLLDLNTITMKIYEFARILGILLDNAIEAASECEEKAINIVFRDDQKNNRNIILVENTYKNKDVNIDNIFGKGVSGKENHTGLGLWEIREILKKSNNLNLYTSKTEKYFSQQLEIYYQ